LRDIGLDITLAQINPIVGALQHNAEKILNIWRNARSDLIVFPELCLTGYPPEDLIIKPFFLERVRETIEKLCEESKTFPAAALIGCPWVMEGQTYNVLHLIEQGKIIATQAKHHLPCYGVFDEPRVFTAGPLPAPLSFRGKKLGLLICEDLWHRDVAVQLKTQGAEILIAANASPFEMKKPARRLDIARARVRETGLPLLYINQIGGQDDLVFDGGSFALFPACHPERSEGSGLDPSTSGLRPFAQDDIILLPSFIEHTQSFQTSAFPVQTGIFEDTPLKTLREALTLALRDYTRKNGFTGILLGLSGGIDSAVSAVIAAEAVGTENVHCVMMPSRFTAQESLDDAAALAKNLGCPYEIIPIAASLAAFENTIPNLTGLAHENAQSRIRGLILMSLSNASGKMVLSTGNKSEMAVGYATLYGDMCGGFNVLKDVYKTQVYELARHINAEGEIIPERIITRHPTAELREHQTDQDSLPPYDVLDAILQGLIEDDLGLEAIIAQGHARETVLKIWQMLDRAEYKRRQSAPGPKITPRAFGKDRRVPITNGFVKTIES